MVSFTLNHFFKSLISTYTHTVDLSFNIHMLNGTIQSITENEFFYNSLKLVKWWTNKLWYVWYLEQPLKKLYKEIYMKNNK